MNKSKTPLPGRPVRGSTTGVPLMAALDLIGRRWTLQIVWELEKGPKGFRELQALCEGISPTILSARLKELREAKIVETDPHGKNRLTKTGRDLYRAVGSLKSWSAKWARKVKAAAK